MKWKIYMRERERKKNDEWNILAVKLIVICKYCNEKCFLVIDDEATISQNSLSFFLFFFSLLTSLLLQTLHFDIAKQRAQHFFFSCELLLTLIHFLSWKVYLVHLFNFFFFAKLCMKNYSLIFDDFSLTQSNEIFFW